jgi:hypothetical protein
MTNYNLFIVSPIVFENKKEDPFGFDALSEKIASEYIPFSGTVRKPIYFLFVAYVNWLLQQESTEYKSKKEKEDLRLRLEKILVLSWKRSNTSLRGRNVIGNSVREINPFRGRDSNWVVQDCFKIYGPSTAIFALSSLIDLYNKKNQRESRLIRNFLEERGPLNQHRERILKHFIDKLKNGKNSLFRGEDVLPKTYSKNFLATLRAIIKGGKFGSDHELMHKLFHSPSRAGSILRGVFKNPMYPFGLLNSWFRTFILAVNAELNGHNSRGLWEETDRYFDRIRKKQIGLGHYSLKDRRPLPRCWFKKGIGSYQKADTFDESAWLAVVRRAEAENRFYSSFRTDALASLLKELSES